MFTWNQRTRVLTEYSFNKIVVGYLLLDESSDQWIATCSLSGRGNRKFPNTIASGATEAKEWVEKEVAYCIEPLLDSLILISSNNADSERRLVVA